MAPKLIEAAGEGLDHPAFNGVPRIAGQASAAGGDEGSLKLLMFVDGSSSLRDLGEVLSMDAPTLAQIVVALYQDGVIAFDPDYASEWLEEAPAPQAESGTPVDEPAAPVAEAAPVEPGPAQDEPPGGERVRIVSDREPEPTAFPEAPRLTQPQPSVAAAPSEPADAQEEMAGEVVEEGSLEDTPAWQVITRLSRAGFRGKIQFTDPAGRRELFMHNGRPVFAVSSHEDEDLGAMLRSRDRISEADYKEYLEVRSKSGADPVKVLVELQIVPEYNILRAQRWQVQSILFTTLDVDTGTFLVEKVDRLPRRLPKFDINFSRIMARFLDEKLPMDEEIEKLQEKMEFYLSPTVEPGEQSFEDKEQRLWEAIQERPRRLKQIVSISTMFRRETYKFVLMLLVNGFVELTKTVAFEEGPVDLSDLENIADDLESRNYFEVLDLHAISDSKDVEDRYQRLVDRFDPTSYQRLDDNQRAYLVRCKARIDKAFEVLRNEKRRDEYRTKTFSSYQLAQFAQLQFQKGEIFLWWRHDPVTAFPFFRSSMEMDPANPLYWAAYAISALGGGTKDPGIRRQSAKLAERVASLKSADPTALVMAGGALIKIGQAHRGEQCLEKAVKLSPGNAAIAKMVKNVVG